MDGWMGIPYAKTSPYPAVDWDLDLDLDWGRAGTRQVQTGGRVLKFILFVFILFYFGFGRPSSNLDAMRGAGMVTNLPSLPSEATR